MKHIILILILSLTVGCTNTDETPELGDAYKDLESKILMLEQELNDQQATIDEQQSMIDEQEKLINEQKAKIEDLEKANSLLEEVSLRRSLSLTVLSDLVHQTVDDQTAILNSAEIKGDQLELNLTYAEKLKDEEAPNGFRLEKAEDNVVVYLDKGTSIYLLNRSNGLMPQKVEWKDVVETAGVFLQLVEQDGEVVFVNEIYIP